MSGLKKWADMGKAWGVPTFVGEFGASHSAASQGPYVAAHWAALDALFAHGAQWEYSESPVTWNDEPLGLLRADGTEYAAITDQIARVYPRAIAGADPTFSFDAATRTFTLDYIATAGGVTELMVPTRVYRDAKRKITVVGGCADETRTDGVVPIVASSAGKVHVGIVPN